MLLPRFSRWRRIRDHLCSSPLLTSFAVPPRHDLSLEFLLMRREQRKRGGICQSHSSISVTLRPLWLLLRGVLIERSEEHTSELQSRQYLVCRLLLEKKKMRHQAAERRSSRAVARRTTLSATFHRGLQPRVSHALEVRHAHGWFSVGKGHCNPSLKNV